MSRGRTELGEVAWLAPLLLAGLAAAAVKLRLALGSPWIGHADAAAYAEMADSLLAGRGFEVDYVSFFFRRYSDVPRPEDHWPPLHALLMAPGFWIFGKSAWAAKLPAIAIGSLLLPVATALLARRLADSGWVALAAGLHVLVFPDFFAHSLRALADVTFAFTVCLVAYLAVRSLDDGRWYIPLGFALALASYAKGSGLVLIPAVVAFHALTRAGPPGPRDRQLAVGLACAGLALLPWWIRNTVHFGNPLFTTQQYVAGFFGTDPFESSMYRLYWGEPLPSLAAKLARWGPLHWAAGGLEAFAQNLWWVFVDFHSTRGRLGDTWLLTGLAGIPAAAGLVLLAVTAPGRWRAASGAGDATWQRPALHALWCPLLALLGFLSISWLPMNRLALPAVPLVAALGWAMLHETGRSPFRGARSRRAAGRGLVAAGGLVVAVTGLEVIRQDASAPHYPYTEDRLERIGDWIRTARWIGAELPGSVTLTRNPWELHFYSEERAVQIPAGGLRDVLRAARHYGATHLIPAAERPALAPWVAGRVPGLRRVRGGPVPVYEILWHAVPAERP